MQRLEQIIDRAFDARAQGFEAEGPIKNSADVVPALSRALEAVDKDHGYLIDVVSG